MSISLVLGCDHGGIELKDALIAHLKKTRPDYTVIDAGTHSMDSCDYPDYADKVVDTIKAGKAAQGILCCGTGIGMSIRANRTLGIRAAVVHDTFTAQMAKQHNNANILCLGNRTHEISESIALMETWLDTQFEGGRHERRVGLLG